MSNKKIILSASVWAVSTRITIRVLGLVQMIIVARLLGTEQVGLFAMVSLVYGLTESFTQFGFEQAIIRKKGEISEYFDILFTLNILRGLFVSLMMCVLAWPVSLAFDEVELMPMIFAMALTPVLFGLQNPANVLFRRDLKLSKEFVLQLSSAIIMLVSGVLYASYSPTAWSFIVAYLSANFVLVVVSYMINPYFPTFTLERKKFNEMFDFGKWLLLAQFSKYFSINLPGWIVGVLLGTSALGLYHLGMKAVQAVSTEVLKILSLVAFPALSALSSNKKSFSERLLKGQQVVTLMVFPFFVLLSIYAKPVIGILMGGGEWYKAVIVIQLMSFFALIQSIGLFAEAFKSLGMTRYIFNLSFLRFMIVCVCVYPFVKLSGLSGAVFTSIIGALVILLPSSIKIQQVCELRVNQFFHKIIPSIMGVLGIYFISLFLPVVESENIYLLILNLAILIISYFSIISMFEYVGVNTGFKHIISIIKCNYK